MDKQDRYGGLFKTYAESMFTWIPRVVGHNLLFKLITTNNKNIMV